MQDCHVLEIVEEAMDKQEQSGDSHPVVMLTRTQAGTLARLQTVGDRYLDARMRPESQTPASWSTSRGHPRA